MNYLIAISIATLSWFVAAAILFFNPIVDKIYQKEEGHPSVRVLPKSPATIAKILLAVVVQCSLWALVYYWIQPSLPADKMHAGLIFAGIIVLMKIIPRDIDRVLLTTYPSQRMTIEFIVGIICALVVGFVYAWWL